MNHREHPAALWHDLPLFIWLLLPALFRGIYLGFALLLLLVVLILLWRRRTFTLSHRDLLLQRGLITRRTTRIPLPLITTLIIEQPLWLRLLGGARVVADTDAGNHRMTDLRLTIHRNQLHVFLPEQNRVRFRAAGWRILLLSVLSSDSFGGFLLLVTVFRQGSVLFGEGLRHTLLNNLESAADKLDWIPKTVAIVTLALAAAWFTGVLRLFLRHLPFDLRRCRDTLTISTGLITRRLHCCALDAVNYLDRRQTLAAYLLGLYTGYISCTGYGKDRNTRAVLIPPCRRRKFQLEERVFLPTMAQHILSIRPAKGALWRYWRLPLSLLVLLPLVGWGATVLFPLWREFILYLTLMATFPCLWLLAVREIDRRTAGVGARNGCICLSYSRFLTLHQVTIPLSKIAMVLVRQSLWQKHKRVCTVKIYSHHEFRRPHPVRHLPLDEVLNLLDRIN